MRTAIVLAVLALIPVFAGLLHWHYHAHTGPKLQREVQNALKLAGLPEAKVRIVYLDALLGGRLATLEQRELAAQVVDGFRGVRLLPQSNRIVVNAELKHRIEGGELRMTGWLPGAEARSVLSKLAAQFRPDLKLNLDDITLAPHVVLGPEVEMKEGKVSSTYRDVLEGLRLPASLTIRREQDVYHLSGVLPAEDQRQALIAAARSSRWKIEHDRLLAVPTCAPAPFTAGDGLVQFVAALFASPSPGEFSIDLRNGARLKAHATAAMENAWRTLLAPVVSGGKVDMRITRVSSAFQFPDYRTQSVLPAGMEKSIRHLFSTRPIYFEPLSATIGETEEPKLSSLVAAMTSAGPEAQYVVAGYGSEELEPGAAPALRVERAEAVRSRLVALGVAENLLETSVFEAVSTPDVDEAQARREARKVEIFLK